MGSFCQFFAGLYGRPALWRFMAECTLAFVIGVSSHRVSPAYGNPLADEFLKKYGEAFEKLENSYSRIRGTATTRYNQPADSEPPIRIQNLEFARNGESVKLTTDVVKDDAVADVKRRVSAASPKYSFRVSRKDESEQYSVEGMSQTDSYKDSIFWSGTAFGAPFRYLDLRIVEFLRLPDVSIESVSEVAVNGETLIRVDWHLNTGTEKDSLGSFVFDPARGMGLREAERRAISVVNNQFQYDEPFNAVYHAVEYDGAFPDGAPRVSKFVAWAEKQTGDQANKRILKRHYREVTEFANLTQEDVSANEFTFSYYGLPEPAQVRNQGVRVIVVAVVAVILLLVAAMLWRRRLAIPPNN